MSVLRAGTKDQICYVLEPLLYGSLARVERFMHDPSYAYTEVFVDGLRKLKLVKPEEPKGESSDRPAVKELIQLSREESHRTLVRYISACLARAVDFMRSFEVAHRDLRPDNIIFDDEGVPKLCDFNHCKKFPYQHLVTKELMVKSYTLVGVADETNY